MFYSSFITAKDGSAVPVLQNGKPLHSKYSPRQEAERFATLQAENDFFVIFGLCGGFHLSALKKRFPHAFILAVEESQADIDFLKEGAQEVRGLLENGSGIAACSIRELAERLLSLYLPALYPRLGLAAHSVWAQENKSAYDHAQNAVQDALKKISADFSVQAHFGKIWTANIMKNLSFAAEHQTKAIYSIPIHKTAVIVAAGPSLKQSLKALKERTDDCYIIATDTAYKALQRRSIAPDAVFSVDAQHVSFNHFSKRNGRADKPQLFIFELTANHSAVVHAPRSAVVFTTSAHPLDRYARAASPGAFFEADSASGTVTIAALDFALRAGFCRLRVIGADFSYADGKAYTEGTYLDDLYDGSASRTLPAEEQFSRLLHRVPLTSLSKSRHTTAVLASYQAAFEQWLQAHGASCTRDGMEYHISIDGRNRAPKETAAQGILKRTTFDSAHFFKELKNDAADLKTRATQTQLLPAEVSQNPLFAPLLPLIAWYRTSVPNKALSEYVNLALNFILRYTY